MARGQKTGGRRKGTPNKTTAEAQAFAVSRSRELVETGTSPLDVMLDNMRFAMEEAGALIKKMNLDPKTNPEDFKQLVRLRGLAQAFAADAAPYVHPKLANVKHSGDEVNPLELVTRIELVAPSRSS